jgi:hypothetical protein
MSVLRILKTIWDWFGHFDTFRSLLEILLSKKAIGLAAALAAFIGGRLEHLPWTVVVVLVLGAYGFTLHAWNQYHLRVPTRSARLPESEKERQAKEGLYEFFRLCAYDLISRCE